MVDTTTQQPASRAASREASKVLREEVPRSSHARWVAAPDRRDPLAVLEEEERTRVPELVAIRHGRMLESPFAFLRGSAGVMAADLASTPTSGLRVQACGDAHRVCGEALGHAHARSGDPAAIAGYLGRSEALTVQSPNSPSRTPTRPSVTTRSWSPLCAPEGSRRRRGSDELHGSR